MLCKKKPLPDILPPLTTSGENTIGCLINGEVFVPTIRRFIGPDNICEKTRLNDFPLYPTYFFMFSACRAVAISDTVNDARIRIKVNNVRNTCDYNIYKAIVTYNKNNYYCDSLRGGVINIVYLDTINKNEGI